MSTKLRKQQLQTQRVSYSNRCGPARSTSSLCIAKAVSLGFFSSSSWLFISLSVTVSSAPASHSVLLANLMNKCCLRIGINLVVDHIDTASSSMNLLPWRGRAASTPSLWVRVRSVSRTQLLTIHQPQRKVCKKNLKLFFINKNTTESISLTPDADQDQ